MIQQTSPFSFEDPRIQKQPTRVEVANVNRSLWKIIAIIAGGVLFAAATGFCVSVAWWQWGGISALLFLSLLVFQGIFIKEWSQIFPGIFFQSLAFIAFLFPVIGIRYTLICFPCIFIPILLGTISAREIVGLSLKISFWKASKAIVSCSFFGALAVLMISLMAPFMEKGTFISEPAFAAMIKSNDPVVAIFWPGYSSDLKVHDVMQLIIEQNLSLSSDSGMGKKMMEMMSGMMPASVNLNALPKSVRDKVVQDTINGIASAIEKQMGGTIDLNATISSNIYNKFLLPRVMGLPTDYRIYIGLAIILLVLLTIKSIDFLLYIPILCFIYIFYQILRASHFVSLRLETCAREILLLE